MVGARSSSHPAPSPSGASTCRIHRSVLSLSTPVVVVVVALLAAVVVAFPSVLVDVDSVVVHAYSPPTIAASAYLRAHSRASFMTTTTAVRSSPPATIDDGVPVRECSVLICGGGPVGLACALSLMRRGYTDIHVLERNPCASYAEIDKSYLYRIDGRGQRLTDELGITRCMRSVSTTTSEFLNYTVVGHDGTVKVVRAQADPNQVEAYWLPRRALLSFLHSRIEEGMEGEGGTREDVVTFHFGASIEGLIMPDGADAPSSRTGGGRGTEARVRARLRDGTTIDFASRRVLGCDGMNSRIRTGLAEWASSSSAAAASGSVKNDRAHRFGMRCVDSASASAGLRYKILTVLDDFPLTKALPTNATRREVCYSYVGRTPPGPRGGHRLGLLPLKMGGIPRTANIIASSTAPIFARSTGAEVLEHLRAEFPQCDVDRTVSAEEAERFARSRGGIFCKPQYCLESQVVLDGGSRTRDEDDEEGVGTGGGVVLLGDAIHVFPPDLGAGVNMGFLDVLDLMASLDGCGNDWTRALPLYEELRAPQSRAICELIPIGFPQQYGHRPMRKSIKLLWMGMRLGLSKALPWLISPPVFFMCQDATLDFSQVWEKDKRTARIIKGLSLTMIGAALQKFAIVPRVIARISRYLP